MPKKFIFTLVIAQLILTFLYWLAYKALLTYFPSLSIHSSGILITFLLTSVAFLTFSVLGYRRDNFFITKAYVLSTITLSLGGYFLIASIVAIPLLFFLPEERQTFGTLAVLTGILFTIYGLINARIIRTTELKVKIPNMPAVWKQRTLVMASDLHLGQVLRIGSAKKMAKKINSLKPDIVFIPGDFYDGVLTDFQALANEFRIVDAPLGVFFSSGNHELFAGYDICEHAIKKAGMKILENEKIEIDGLQIIGLAYLGSPKTREPETDGNVKARLSNLNINPHKPSILLKHVPNHLHAVEHMGVNFQISGHSHQGQIWPGRHITKRVWKSFDYGFKTLGKLQIYTSSGVGTWGPPLRIFTKSEIVKITFE